MTQQGYGKNERFVISYDDQQGQFNLASGSSGMTLQRYRDTSFIVEHTRHDQDDVIGYYKFQFTHRKKLATALTSAHIHYIPVGANPSSDKVVRFSLSYVWVNSNGTFPAVSGWTTTTSDLTIGTTSQYIGGIHSIATNVAAPSGEGYSSWLLIRITRLGTDGADTYTESNPDWEGKANLVILGVDCHIQVDRSGSFQEGTD
jgi:hypothetical protein